MECQHLAGTERVSAKKMRVQRYLAFSRTLCQQDAGVPTVKYIFVEVLKII